MNKTEEVEIQLVYSIRQAEFTATLGLNFAEYFILFWK